MSNRATYQFLYELRNHPRFAPKTVVYIHDYNHFAAAAERFYAVLCNQSKGDFATQFIRHNVDAEITTSPEYHGDADYHYLIHGDNGYGSDAPDFSLQCRYRDGFDTWQSFTCSMRAFIHNNATKIEDYSPFQQVKTRYLNLWLNQHTARRKIEDDILHHLQVWQHYGTMPADSANWQGMVDNLVTILKKFPELATEETDKYAATLVRG